jgi:Ni2+-binding GTPase involved in maturation of urease and hydrogenase
MLTPSVASLSALMLRPEAPIEKAVSVAVIKRPTKKPRKVHEALSQSDVHVLVRTRMAQDFGKRIFSFEENVEFISGKNTTWKQWNRLKRLGYVTENRSGPRLTPKGVAKLKELGL